MEAYKYNKNCYDYIEPMPGDIVDLDDGTRLKVVESVFTNDQVGTCRNCFLDNPSCHADIDQKLLRRLCSRTSCNGVIRKDSVDIHYEEVSDAT